VESDANESMPPTPIPTWPGPSFKIVLWQLTNDVKKKFYAVLLAEALLNLAQENQKTFAEIIKHTTEVFQLGEISGLDLQRLEIEKFKFDTDVANSERDYELALRDLRVTLEETTELWR